MKSAILIIKAVLNVDERAADAVNDIVVEALQRGLSDCPLGVECREACALEGITEEALALCHRIEECGASDELTGASLMASTLHQKLSQYP